MPESPSQILIVTPVWNDSTRLAVYGRDLAKSLAASPLGIRWIIADDGSGPSEEAPLLKLRDDFAKLFPAVSVHFAAAHRGKGSVVREAWALAPDAAWLAFVDADGSVSAEDFLMLIEQALSCGTSVIGIRKRTDHTQIEESPWRSIAHRGFLFSADTLLGLRCEDLQCGAKVIHGGDYRRIEPRLDEDGLAFDCELLHNLNRSGATWKEVPVNWIEKKGGKVKPLRDAWGMLAALFRIRNRPW